jgi:hypothetical protein
MYQNPSRRRARIERSTTRCEHTVAILSGLSTADKSCNDIAELIFHATMRLIAAEETALSQSRWLLQERGVVDGAGAILRPRAGCRILGRFYARQRAIPATS